MKKVDSVPDEVAFVGTTLNNWLFVSWNLSSLHPTVSHSSLFYTSLVESRQLGLPCTFSTRLSWAHTPVINWVVCLGQ